MLFSLPWFKKDVEAVEVMLHGLECVRYKGRLDKLGLFLLGH